MVGKYGGVRLGLENGDYGELVLLAVDARVQGRVDHVPHAVEQEGAGGGA